MEETTTLGGMQTPGKGVGGAGSATRLDMRLRSFRVRLMRFDRPKSRMLLVRARDEAEARARALDEAGRDWRITSVHVA